MTFFLRRTAVAAVLLTVPMGSAVASASTVDSGVAVRAVPAGAVAGVIDEHLGRTAQSAVAAEAVAAAMAPVALPVQAPVAGVASAQAADASTAGGYTAAAAKPKPAPVKPKAKVKRKTTKSTVGTTPKRTTKVVAKPVSRPRTQPAKTAPQRVTAPASGLSALENEVIRLTNAQRSAHGCKAVATDGRLTIAARGHSADMAAANYFSHVSPGGGTFTSRSSAAGYDSAMSENIAWGWPTAQVVVQEWMNSAGHRANILNCSAVVVGVGAAKKSDGTIYWTQVFGRA